MNTEQNPVAMPQVKSLSEKTEKKKGGKKQMQFEKLRIATEKLQMQRVKTTLTLIALGFASYKFFFARFERGQAPLMESFNGRTLGIVLIAVGFVMLVIATLQHIRSITKLKLSYKDKPFSVSLLLSGCILALAVFLLFVIILRL